MKRYGKHIVAWILAAALILSMTGCSTAAALLLNGAEPAATPEPASTPVPAAEPELTAMPAPTAEPDEPEVPVTPAPSGVEITEENYRMLFAPAPDFDYIGIAYMKAPEAYGRFIDAYLPYGDMLEYLEGGYAVQSTAHGMRVYETMVEVSPESTAEDAIQVLMNIYQGQTEIAGEEIEEVSDVNYYEEYDVAVQSAYSTTAFADHYTVLLADTREDGFYFCAMITYLPEEYDEEQPALLAEMNGVFGLELPVI